MTITRSPSSRDVVAAAPTAATPEMLTVLPERVLLAHILIIVVLVALYTVAKSFHVLGGHDYLLGFGPLLDLDRESNLPAFYSTLLVLANAGLVALTGTLYRGQRRANTWYWFFLAAMFLFLAFDEAFAVHEQIGLAIRSALGNRRAAHLNFAIAGFAFTVVIAVLSIRFLMRLDRRTRLLMIVSGAVFVGGALGFEILGGLRHEVVRSTVQKPDPVYLALVAGEETLEMLGMALFGYALLDHLRAQFGRLTFRFD
jgi:hypothetical protein